MPLVDAFNGIKIWVYSREHRPPHIHAVYGEYEVLILIETGEIYSGHLPNRKQKQIIDWLSKNSDKALSNFYELNPTLK